MKVGLKLKTEATNKIQVSTATFPLSIEKINIPSMGSGLQCWIHQMK